MLVLKNEARSSLCIPCKVLDGVTLPVHVIWRNTRHYVSSSRKMLHLIDVDWSQIAHGTEKIAASDKFGMNCFSKCNAIHIYDRILISELEELQLVEARYHGIATNPLHL